MAGRGRTSPRVYDSTLQRKLGNFKKINERLEIQKTYPENSFLHGMLLGLKPDKVPSLVEWAEQNRVLSVDSSAEPGPYKVDRTPYLREIFECLSPSSPIEKVVFMKASQVGATECANCWLGYVLSEAPGPMLAVQPNIDMLRKWVLQRINPMIEGTLALRGLKDSTSSDLPQSVSMKQFSNGATLIVSSSGTSKGLSSMPVRYLMLDEVDRYPLDVAGEGDPCELAVKRTVTFRKKKIFMISTPTESGASRIETEYSASDKRKFYVPCPHCGGEQELIFQYLKWAIDEQGAVCDIYMECWHCGKPIEERHKQSMMAKGVWKKDGTNSKTAGFHLSGLYSPWQSWHGIAEKWERASKENDINLLKVITNTDLGLVWQERYEKVLPEGMSRRCEAYTRVPDKVLCIVSGVDVQDNSLHMNTVGFGVAEESWGLEYKIINGHVSSPDTWKALDEYLFNKEFITESGLRMKILRACIDSSDNTDLVYQYIKPREERGMIAVKGSATPGRGIVSNRPSKQKYSVNLYIVGVTAAKDLIYHRLRNLEPGTGGFMHFNMSYDAEFFKELLGERIIRKKWNGRMVRTYE